VIVLDTNVVSELMRPVGDDAVITWVRESDPSELATTAITVAEIEYGLARLPDGARTEALRKAAASLWVTFAATILPFDSAAAHHYGQLMADRERAGRPTGSFDVQIAAIAAIAKAHQAHVATRNIADFRDMGITLVDPWQLDR
jgi:predicted nucleic acid-binding protein